MLARYIHGPNAGADDPIAEYTGASVAASARQFCRPTASLLEGAGNLTADGNNVYL